MSSDGHQKTYGPGLLALHYLQTLVGYKDFDDGDSYWTVTFLLNM